MLIECVKLQTLSRVTDEALIAETAVWLNFFLMNVFFAIEGSKLFIIIYQTHSPLFRVQVEFKDLGNSNAHLLYRSANEYEFFYLFGEILVMTLSQGPEFYDVAYCSS